MFDRVTLEEALGATGALLADRGLHHELVAIGGAALAILGLIERATEDLDLVAIVGSSGIESAVTLPEALRDAIQSVAELYRLPPNWMNNGPAPMIQLGLPPGLLERCTRREYGGLGIAFAARIDQIYFKVYAAADNAPGGKHHLDLQALRPLPDELRAAVAWARTHDPSEEFAAMARQLLASFGVELDDD